MAYLLQELQDYATKIVIKKDWPSFILGQKKMLYLSPNLGQHGQTISKEPNIIKGHEVMITL